jgi:hypothetical protein
MSMPEPGSDGLFNVDFTEFAATHYIKVFARRHGKAWEVTQRAIAASLQRVDSLLGTNKLEPIHKKDACIIAKFDFAVAGRKESAKASGNRAIVFIDNELRLVKVLLVYSKNEISSPNETQKWQSIIKTNHSDIWNQFFS